MTGFYSETQRGLQDSFGTRRLADRLEETILRSALTESDRDFISASDHFYLSTLDHRGFPSVSYKGGDPDFVRIVDDRSLAFPLYDGNGMFFSAGNVVAHDQVGMLFIDVQTPRRLRLHGRARVETDSPVVSGYLGAQGVVMVALEDIFQNCPRYIHRHTKVEASPNVPRKGQDAPVPDWKRRPEYRDVLPEVD